VLLWIVIVTLPLDCSRFEFSIRKFLTRVGPSCISVEDRRFSVWVVLHCVVAAVR